MEELLEAINVSLSDDEGWIDICGVAWITEGNNVGFVSFDWSSEGIDEGWWLGGSDGINDGWLEGLSEGIDEGWALGDSDGIEDGWDEGWVEED